MPSKDKGGRSTRTAASKTLKQKRVHKRAKKTSGAQRKDI